MRRIQQCVLVAVLLLLIVGGVNAQTERRQVYAFYFGWWTDASWNNANLIDRPAAPYDSRNAGVVGRQIDEAKSAGIDAFIMSWFGPKNGNLTHQTFNILLDQAAARGFKAGAVVDMVDANYNATAAEVTESLSYLINDRANHPAYLRYAGKPVIYFWNQARFTVNDWAVIRAQVDPNRNTIWVMEGTNTAFLPTFDGLYLFNTAWAGDPAATASGWFAKTRAAGGWFYTPSVLPGWDESRLAGRPNATSPRDRANGQFLTNSWNGAAASGAGVILIVSWNEYFENSHIEPSQLHGSQALDTLRPLIANWKAGGPVAVPSGSNGQVAAPSGPAVTVLRPNVFSLNVRSAPGTDSQVLGQVGVDDVFVVNGEAEGWYQISYNGQDAWLSAEYVGLSQEVIATAASGGGADGGAAAGGAAFTTNYILSLREGPGEGFNRLDSIPYLTTLTVLGRTADEQWVQVDFNGQTGWVAAWLGNLNTPASLIRVTG